MKKIFLLSWVVVCFFAAQGNAQARYDWSQKKYTVAIQPMQLLFKNSLRLDFEVRIADGPGWLQFGPAAYYAKGEEDYFCLGNRAYRDGYRDLFYFSEPFTSLLGGGLDINYKWFFDAKRSLYLLSGLSFTHFDIKYWGSVWSDYIEDGLQYSGYLPADFNHQHVNRPGANFLFGFQVPSRHLFLFDMFGGFSYRYSVADKGKPSYNEEVFSYGYTGWVFVTGVRFGIGIK
ncbi:MAG: hypothetical protein FWG54_04800 [Bacteroidetes bacterium]|nr:hypothetical protein [Bacteroidota bacterium]